MRGAGLSNDSISTNTLSTLSVLDIARDAAMGSISHLWSLAVGYHEAPYPYPYRRCLLPLLVVLRADKTFASYDRRTISISGSRADSSTDTDPAAIRRASAWIRGATAARRNFKRAAHRPTHRRGYADAEARIRVDDEQHRRHRKRTRLRDRRVRRHRRHRRHRRGRDRRVHSALTHIPNCNRRFIYIQ